MFPPTYPNTHRLGLEAALAGRIGRISGLHLCATPGIMTPWHTGVSE